MLPRMISIKTFYSSSPPHYPRQYMKKWEVHGNGKESYQQAKTIGELLTHYQYPPRDGVSIENWLKEILLWGDNNSRKVRKFEKEKKKRRDEKRRDDSIGKLTKIIGGKGKNKGKKVVGGKGKRCPAEVLAALSECGIPQFGYTSFGSKLLMFWRPREFVVLDTNIRDYLKRKCEFPKKVFSDRDTAEINKSLKPIFDQAEKVGDGGSMPVKTLAVRVLYCMWCQFCQNVAEKYGDKKWKASDIERLYFASAVPSKNGKKQSSRRGKRR